MTIRIKDKLYPQRAYMFDGKIVDFRNYHADVEPDMAYRISRVSMFDDFVIEDKRIPYDPDSWIKDKRLIWCANVGSASGFGMVSENVIRELLRAGIKVENPKSITNDVVGGGEFVDEIIKQTMYKNINPTAIEIQYCQAPMIISNVAERIWHYGMYETTITPKKWIKEYNKCERILVPSQWLVENWKELGVTVPIHVFGHGIDPNVYHYMDRPEDRDVFTFLQYGQLDERKGVDITWKAFSHEFGDDPNVRLVLKTNRAGIIGVPLEDEDIYPNLKVIRAIYSKEQMNQLLFDADCFVFPTRGEGFGIPPLEAMAAGLPSIITDWSGVVDFSDPDDTLIVGHEMVRSYMFDIIYNKYYDKTKGENSGYWAEPSYEDVRKQMRWAYEHRAEAKAKGKRAAARIAKDWTWKKKTQELLDLITQYA